MHPWQENAIKAGVTYEELLDSGTDVNRKGLPRKQLAEWRAERLAWFRDSTAHAEIEREDGSHVLAIQHKTSDGGTVALRIDITAQKLAEQKASQAQRQLAEAIEILPASFMLFDKEDRLVLFNEQTKEMLHWHKKILRVGITQDELIRHSAAKQIHSNSIDRIDEYIKERMERHKNPEAKFEVQRKDGTWGWVSSRKMSDGGTLVVRHDITEVKQAEQRAAQAERRLIDAIESLPAGFALFDKDEKLVMANKQMAGLRYWQSEIWAKPGVTFEQIIDNSLKQNEYANRGQKNSSAKYLRQAKQVRLERFREAMPPRESERADGTWVLSSTRKTSDGGRVVIRVDITEQKQDQQRAAEAEMRLANAIESLPIGFAYFDRDERLVLANKKMQEIRYWQKDLWSEKGTSFETLVTDALNHPEYQNRPNAIRSVKERKRAIAHRIAEFRNPTPPREAERSDGSWILSIKEKTSDGGRVIIRIDITDLKKSEQRAAAAEQRLLDAIESLPIGFALFDNEERLVLANSATKEMQYWQTDFYNQIGATVEEMYATTTSTGEYTARPDGPKSKKELQRHIENRLERFRNPGPPKERHRADDSWVLAGVKKTSDGGRVVIRVDITETKQAQQRATEAEGRLIDALESLPVGFALFDNEERLVLANQKIREQRYWQPEFYDQPGATIEEMYWDTVNKGEQDARLGQRTTKKQRAEHVKRLVNIFRNPEAPRENRRSNGTWMQSHVVKTSNNGRVLIRVDITDLKNAQQQATEAEHIMLEALNSLPVGIALYDQDEKLLIANQTLAAIRPWNAHLFKPGTHYEEIIKSSANKQMVPSATGRKRAYLKERLERFQNPGQPRVNQRLDGRWELSSEQKTPSGRTVSLRVDITQQKIAEERANQAWQILQDAIESLPVGFALYDKNEKLVMANKKLKMLRHAQAHLYVPGTSFHDIIADTVEKGLALPVKGRSNQAAIKQRLKKFRNPGLPSEVVKPDGHWELSYEEKTSTGGTLSVRVDITETKRAEARAVAVEQCLIDAMESLPAAFIVYDKDDKVVLANQRSFEHMKWLPGGLKMGMKFEDIIRKAADHGHIADAIKHEDKWVAERLEQHIEGKSATVWQRTDGTWIQCYEHRTSEGGVVSVRFDVTPQKSTELALRDSEENYRNLVEGSLQRICISTGQEIAFANQALADIFGYRDAQEIIELGAMANLAMPHEQSKIIEFGRQRRSGGNAPPLDEFEGVQKNNRPIWLQAIAKLVNWKGQLAIQTIMVDITDRIFAERKLRFALEKAEEANRSKSDFLARMSHELRTPLNAIIGFAEVQKNEMFGSLGNPRYVEYSKDIFDAGRHLLDLINDILDLSKIEAGKFDIYRELINIRTVVDDAIQVIGDQYHPKGITLFYEIPDTISPFFADRRATRQMLLNLLSNAYKFTPRGGQVTISALNSEDGFNVLTISDTGLGMDPNDFDLVLAPFTQKMAVETASEGGTGLGLPIVKSLIELHGGSISLQSELNKGTKVSLFFPKPSEHQRQESQVRNDGESKTLRYQ
jgi:PAS domain S-box-containing protein